MKHSAFKEIIVGNKVSYVINARTLIMASLLFVSMLLINRFISANDLEVKLLLSVGFTWLYFVGSISRQLGQYFDKLEEALTQEIEKKGNGATLLTAPHWKPYRADAFASWRGNVALIIFLSTFFLRKFLGIHVLPAVGLFAFGFLVGFNLLISFGDYLAAIRKLYLEFHRGKPSNLRNDMRGYLIRYWLILFSVFSISVIVTQVYSRFMGRDLDIFRVLPFSAFVGVVVALTMALVYAFREFSQLLGDLDRIKAISEGGGTGIHHDVSY